MVAHQMHLSRFASDSFGFIIGAAAASSVGETRTPPPSSWAQNAASMPEGSRKLPLGWVSPLAPRGTLIARLPTFRGLSVYCFLDADLACAGW